MGAESLSSEVDFENYIHVPISSFFFESPPEFDIFVKINNKFVIYHKKNDSIDSDRFKRLREKNLTHMIIRKESHELYYSFVKDQIYSLYENLGNMTPVEKANSLLLSTLSLLEDFHNSPSRSEYIHYLEEAHDKITSFLNSSSKALPLFLTKKNSQASLFHHEFNTHILAYSMIRFQKEESYSDSELKDLSLACFLHDHFHISPEQVQPEEKMSRPDAYYSHPSEIEKITSLMPEVSFRTNKIILQHLERSDGTGRPQGLRKGSVDPLTFWLISALEFDRNFSFYKKDFRTSLKDLLIKETGRIPILYMNTLKKLLSHHKLI